MSTLANIPSKLSNSFESLPSDDEPVLIKTEQENEELLVPLLSDSSPILIVTAGYDHTIRFWDVLQGTCTATLQHNESVIIG